jgi:uncharacterized membrane protein
VRPGSQELAAREDHPTDERSPSLPAHRLLLFSDAVVAIAITLLVLPLVDLVPEAARAGESPLAVVTEHLVPIGSFLLSFLVIWRIWSVHHQVFARATTVSPLVVHLDVVWLAAVVVLPFPAEMVGAYGDDPVVLVLYVGVLVVSAIALALMAVALRRTGGEGAPGRAVVEQVVGNAVCLAVALVLVVTVPGVGFWPLLLLLLDGAVLAAARRVLPAVRRAS